MNLTKKYNFTDLRQRATKSLANQQTTTLHVLQKSDIAEQFQLHIFELEMQNDELQHVQIELAVAQQKYSDLYHLAPIGYLTIADTEGEPIIEVNQMAAKLLQMNKNALINHPLTHFIFSADQDLYYFHWQKLVRTQLPQTCEIRLKRDNTYFYAKVQTVIIKKPDQKEIYYLTVISDITAQKKAEIRLTEYNELLEIQVTERTKQLETVKRQLQEHSEELQAINSKLSRVARLKL